VKEEREGDEEVSVGQVIEDGFVKIIKFSMSIIRFDEIHGSLCGNMTRR